MKHLLSIILFYLCTLSLGYSQSKFFTYKISNLTTKNVEGDFSRLTQNQFLNKTIKIEKFGDHVTLFLPGQTFHLKRDYRYKDHYSFYINRNDKFSDIVIYVIGLDNGNGRINVYFQEIYHMSELGFGENAYQIKLFAHQIK